MNPLADANAIYQPAVQAAQAQAPAIAQLYQSLTQGLQNQANQGQVSIADWAARAGVASPMLNQQIGANLQGEAGLQSAVVGAEAARGQANLGQQIGGMNVDKAGAIQALSESLAQEQRQNQMNQYQMSDIERQAQLDQTKNQRSYNLEVAQRQAAAAAAAAKANQAKGEMFVRGQRGGTTNFGFKNDNGKNISAAKYAELNGLDIRDVLAGMASQGDKYSEQVLRQLHADPNPSANLDQYKKLYSKLFWGT